MLATTCPVTTNLAAEKVQSAEYKHNIYNSLAELDEQQWNAVTQGEHLFFDPTYLRGICENTKDLLKFRYIVLEKNGQPYGVAVSQIVTFEGKNFVDESPDKGFGGKLMEKVVHQVDFRLLVIGSSLTTGEYGFLFKNKPTEADLDAMLCAVSNLLQTEKKEGKKVHGVLVKDFYDRHVQDYKMLEENGFLQAYFQPNMIYRIPKGQATMEEYMAAMKSKYRVRVKKAIKRIAPLTRVEIGLEELKEELPRLQYLYDQVLDASAFKLTKTTLDHYVTEKTHLGDRFKIYAYKDDKGQILSFITYYIDGKDLVAGYTGFDREIRDDYDLYLNILLTLVERGMEEACETVTFGRTAMEIKSSVGAEPHDMVAYVRHTSNWKNAIVKLIIKRLNKPEQWTQRSPFK